MSEPTNIFNINIFIGLDEPVPAVVEPKAKPTRLDPIAELRAGAVGVEYTVRYQSNGRNGFMDFTTGNRRWLNILIDSLRTIGLTDRLDRAIMDGIAKPRSQFNASQTWQELIDGIYADKVKMGLDFTEGQMRNVAKLVGLLSKGKTLAGCGSIEFVEQTNGRVLV